MPQLVNLVVHDPGMVHALAEAWVTAGVTGMTILDSSGLSHMTYGEGARDDLPLFPSLRKMMEGSEHHSRLLMSVVPDGFDLDGLIVATERVLGPLGEPDSGILFVVPVTQVRGLQSGSGASPKPAARPMD
jgi:nitrogen regulatory protein P-II 1